MDNLQYLLTKTNHLKKVFLFWSNIKYGYNFCLWPSYNICWYGDMGYDPKKKKKCILSESFYDGSSCNVVLVIYINKII